MPKSTKPISKVKVNDGRVYIRKKKPYDVHKEVYNTDANYYLGRMEVLKADGLVRKNMFGSEVIWGGTKYHFSNSKDRSSFKHVFLFSMVRRDAITYASKRTIKPTKSLPAVVRNNNIVTKGKQQWPADMDDAYWTIAYKMKIISEKTYNKGILMEKRICNAALASLGSDKRYSIIRNGKMTNHRVVIVGDPILKMVYARIRNRCFRYMQQLRKILGKDFVKYETDCITYIKTDKNMAKVEAFMKKNKLEYKGGVALASKKSKR